MDKKQSSCSTLVSPKPKIEDSLLLRSQKLKHKLSQVKIRKVQSELKKAQAGPKISERSRRLASKSSTNLIVTSTRIKRTHEILKSSNLMPKQVKLSMATLNPSRNFPKIIAKKAPRYDLIFTSPLAEEKITFPSLEVLLNSPEDSMFPLPDDISTRNQRILELKHEETEDHLNSAKSLSVQERSQAWLQKKNEKIKEMKEKSETLATECCTFRPTLKSKSTSQDSTPCLSVKSIRSPKFFNADPRKMSGLSSQKSFREHSSVEVIEGNARVKRSSMLASFTTTNESISPYSLNVSRSSGYSESFKKKLKPLINYGILNIRP